MKLHLVYKHHSNTFSPYLTNPVSVEYVVFRLVRSLHTILGPEQKIFVGD